MEENEELNDDIQGAKVAFIITLLVAVYCFSVVMESFYSHEEWKIIFSVIGFIIVSGITIVLFIRLVDLKKAQENIPEDSD